MIVLLLALGILTLASLAFLIWPVRERASFLRSRLDYDLSVYRDQSSEVDRDVALGVTAQMDGESARLEIARRILAAESFDRNKTNKTKTTNSGRATIVVVSICLVGATWLIYGLLGSPKTRSQPFAERATNDPSYPVMVQLQHELKMSAGDGSATRLAKIGSLYMALGDPSDATTAFRAATVKDPKNSQVWSSLGESLVLLHSGVMTPEVVDAFRTSYSLDRHNLQAEFFLGLAAEQATQFGLAIAIWKDVLLHSAAKSPLAVAANSAIAAASNKSGLNPTFIQAAAPDGS